jgi:hypothetical protein
MQESRELHTALDSRIRGNDGDGFVTKTKQQSFKMDGVIAKTKPWLVCPKHGKVEIIT